MFIRENDNIIYNVNAIRNFFKKKEFFHGEHSNQWRYYVCAEVQNGAIVHIKEFEEKEERDKYFEKLWELLRENRNFNISD